MGDPGKPNVENVRGPSVSVIIPTCNRARYIPESLKSVFAQTYTDFEVIVVDDGSTDNTKEVLAPYLDSIRYYEHAASKGASAARNLGIRQSKGKYLAFLDSDDLWTPQVLEKAVAVFERDGEVGLVAFSWRVIDPDGALVDPGEVHGKRTAGDRFTPEDLLNKDFGELLLPIIRRECFENVGLYDERFVMGGDMDLYLRISARYKAIHIPEPLCYYRRHGSNLTKNILVRRYYALQAAKKFVAAHPDFAERNSRLVRRALSKKYAHLAKYLLLYEGSPSDIPIGLWHAIGSSLHHNPLNTNAYRYALFACIGPWAYRQWNRLRQSRSGNSSAR